MFTDVVLTPSKTKPAVFLFIATLLLGVGGYLLRQPALSSAPWSAYVLIGFAGLWALVQILFLTTHSSSLTMDGEGFESRLFWRGTKFRWSEVEKFAPVEVALPKSNAVRKIKLVAFRFSPSCASRELPATMRIMAESMPGYDGALPDTFGLKPEELAALLTQKKAEHGKRTAQCLP
jgi:hypothetical protein